MSRYIRETLFQLHQLILFPLLSLFLSPPICFLAGDQRPLELFTITKKVMAALRSPSRPGAAEVWAEPVTALQPVIWPLPILT